MTTKNKKAREDTYAAYLEYLEKERKKKEAFLKKNRDDVAANQEVWQTRQEQIEDIMGCIVDYRVNVDMLVPRRRKLKR